MEGRPRKVGLTLDSLDQRIREAARKVTRVRNVTFWLSVTFPARLKLGLG